MLNAIIEFSIRNKLIVGLFIVGLIAYGSYELTRLPIDAVPDITDNQVQVITVAPSFGATDIERLVTFPVEQVNNNIPGLKQIRSFSRFGLSVVTIVFDDATDIYWARQQVAERLQKVQADIPAGIGRPELGPVTTGLGEIYQYVVRAKPGYEQKYSETELRTIQDWIIRRQLLGVPGVAEVSSFGGKLKQYSIEIDPDKLMSHGLTITDVFRALEQNNQNTGGAYIEKGPTVLYIRSEGLVGNIDDIRNIAVKHLADGTPLFIRDVADVKIGYATRYGAMTYNDKGEAAGAVVMMLKGGNSSDVIKRVKERMAQIQKTLPEGVVAEPFLDRTKMVNNAISTVERNLGEGALIVVFVLVLFLGNLRAGLLVASVIPLAMLFAVIMMNLFGVSGNLMSLGALDFGLIVDGAVIIVEAVMHRLTHNPTKQLGKLSPTAMDATVGSSAGKMMNSAVFGQIIILIVYLPIFTLQGIEGKMFKPMAQTVAFALLGAFLLSLTYIPMMSALVLSRKTGHTDNFSDRMMARLEAAYQKALQRVVTIPKMVVAGVVLLFAVAVVVLMSLGGEFIPALEEGDFAVETRVLTGSSIPTTVNVTQKAAHILLSRFPEVQKVVTKIGSGEVPTDPMPMDAGDVIIVLKDKKEWTSAETFPELSEKMSKALTEVPGITTSFQFPVQMRFNELMTGARQDVVCKIYGEDLDTLAAYAAKLGGIVSSVKGTTALYVEAVAGMPQVIISYNRAAVAQYGLNIEDINNIVNAAFAGRSAGMVFEGERRFDMVVRLANARDKDVADIRNLLIPVPSGTQVPLYQLANVEIKEGPNQVQREDARRRIIVGFNVRGRDVQSIVTELQGKVDKQLKLPAGYSVVYGGTFENLNAAKARLAIAVPVSLLLIYLLLFFAFRSLRQGLLIYSAIPLSAIGGILFLALRGMPFSISAGIGFIALFGVAVLNGIVLIAEFNRLRDDGMTDIMEIIMTGTKLRLRPVLMTAMVASLGFLPMALSHGAGAEVQRPLATVVIGGLMIATFLTLFVLPILYMLFEKRSFKVNSGAAAAIVLLCLLAVPATSNAQVPITLQAAIDTARHNNLQARNTQLYADYRQALIRTGAAIPTTTVSGERGQINSAYTDNKFSVGQSISFPTVYVAQRRLLDAEWQSSKYSAGQNTLLLKKHVTESYYLLQYLHQKELLLQQADSIYAIFLQKAELRLQKGEANVLETATATSQRSLVHVQLAQLQQEKNIQLLYFRTLLNTTLPLEPAADDAQPLTAFGDTTPPDGHPQLQVLKQQMQVAGLTVKAERAKLLPELSASYNSMTIKGIGADEKLYDGSTRFSTVQVGLGIPLFPTAQTAQIKAAKINRAIAENNYNSGVWQFKAQYAEAFSRYMSCREVVNYFEQTSLPAAAQIITTAMRQLEAGSINYLEWTQLMNYAVTVRNDHIEAVHKLNDAAAEANYYANN